MHGVSEFAVCLGDFNGHVRMRQIDCDDKKRTLVKAIPGKFQYRLVVAVIDRMRIRKVMRKTPMLKNGL